jgi:hypothetical protein
MSAEKGWIGEPQPEKEWHTPGWLSKKATGHSHFHPKQGIELDIAKLRADTDEAGWMTGAPWITGGRDGR